MALVVRFMSPLLSELTVLYEEVRVRHDIEAMVVAELDALFVVCADDTLLEVLEDVLELLLLFEILIEVAEQFLLEVPDHHSGVEVHREAHDCEIEDYAVLVFDDLDQLDRVLLIVVASSVDNCDANCEVDGHYYDYPYVLADHGEVAVVNRD